MKRLLTILIVLLLSQAAKAQLILGGNIGISIDGNNSRVGVNIAPEIGYRVLPSLDIGTFMSYRSLYNSFGITPYLRWHFVNIANRVSFFIATTAPMRFWTDFQSYGINLRPGITVNISDNVAFQAHIGTFGYCWEKSGANLKSYWLARLNGDSISVGFCFGI